MNFSDIPGQKAVIERLRNSVLESRVSHALLFYGPEGGGKLPLALAFARYISCERRTAEEACGTCPSCIKYDKLIHPDLHFVFPVVKKRAADTKEDDQATGAEMKGSGPPYKKRATAETVSDSYLPEWREMVLASPWFSLSRWTDAMGAEKNQQALIAVAEAAEIIRKLSLKSFESDFKIMIIWLPEKMNTETANKLLKMIEEPPARTLFLLVTDEEEKLLPTITSRCQHIRVPAIAAADITGHLVERMGHEPAAAAGIAAISNGNMVRAMELMREDDDSGVHLDRFIRLMRTAYSREIQALVNWSEETAALGRERQKSFLSYALRMIRENFILNFNGKEHGLVSLAPAEDEFSQKFHTFINEGNITRLNREYNLAYAHVEGNGNTKIIFLDLALKTMRLIR